MLGASEMRASLSYQLLADAVLVLHFAVVLFVVGGLFLIVAGNLLAWRWVNSPWFRVGHIAAIGVVVAESWLGIICALTTAEVWLRIQAGSTFYRESFIEHWVQRLLFYEAPPWVFSAVYTLFGLLVMAAWWYFPPRFRKPGRKGGT
jgi:hypothetical protein